MEAPRHIAIIMDGNGRWAQARGLPRTEGHRAGGETVRISVQPEIVQRKSVASRINTKIALLGMMRRQMKMLKTLKTSLNLAQLVILTTAMRTTTLFAICRWPMR